MSRYWVLEPKAVADPPLPLSHVTALLAPLGLSHRHAVAESLLRIVGAQVALAQCTIFAYEGSGRPKIVAVGDRARTLALPDISEAYVSRFYRLDGSVKAMQAELAAARKCSAGEPRIVLHLQRGADITHAEYRRMCYEAPQVAERLAILALFEGRRWLSVNLYRGTEHGPFSAADIACAESFAPLVVHAVRLHHTGQALSQDLSALLLGRLLRRFPALTQRDCDVVQALMDGCSTERVAQRLGLSIASAQTYQKRVYRKLGVSGQRELVGLLMAPDPGL